MLVCGLKYAVLHSFFFFSRFLGSFGRAGSVEDVSDGGREHGDGDIQSPAEFWTSKIQRVQPGMKVVIGYAQPSLLRYKVQRYFTRFINKLLVSEGLKTFDWCMLLITGFSFYGSFLCVGRIGFENRTTQLYSPFNCEL
jgi:hypothetical protein